jgi:hypothetical protein
LHETFAGRPVRLASRREQMQPTLPIANDERVSGGTTAEKIGQRSREVLPRYGSERLASAKPDEGVRSQPIAQGGERCVVPMAARECRAVEAFTSDMDAAPLAVTPVLHFGNGLLGSMRRQPAKALVEALCSVCAVDPTESPVEQRAAAPRSREPEARAIDARAVEENQTKAVSHPKD